MTLSVELVAMDDKGSDDSMYCFGVEKLLFRLFLASVFGRVDPE